MDIKIKYHTDGIELNQIDKGDWVDLKSAEDYLYTRGDVVKVNLGVSMELPTGYEALVAPRSSTFKYYGLTLTNSVGIIDNSYSGDNDIWMAQFIAHRTGHIFKGDRVCQFRIIKSMDKITFEVVDKLGNDDRGGFGSTGR